MTFKLWHKLALTIVGITSVILILALILSQQSVKTGFLDYLNEVEESRIDDLSIRLINDYEFYGDWEFLQGKKKQWHRYVRESKPSRLGGARDKRKPPPRLEELGKRFGDHGSRPPPRPPPRRRRDEEGGRGFEQGNDRFPPARRRPPPPHERRPPPPPQALSLLDAQQHRVVGFRAHTKNAINKPLVFESTTIGYLRMEPFTEIVDELDQQFIEHQQRAFIKIALVALLLTLIGAWVLALYLRRRIDQIAGYARRLMEGKYTEKIKQTSSDELGQLANHLNHLGKTLHENKQSRQQWIADISHELRTPLAILRGQVEALEDGIRPLDDKAVQLLGGEVKRLGKLVEDLYQLSLSDLGALAYVKETLNLSDLIEELMDHFQQRLTEKDLELKVSLMECSSANILGDSQRLRQLFINILENSIRYTDQGGRLQVSCMQQDNRLFLCIEDSSPSVLLISWIDCLTAYTVVKAHEIEAQVEPD